MDKNRSAMEDLLKKSSLSPKEKEQLVAYIQQLETPELRLHLLEKFTDDLSGNDSPGITTSISENMLQHIHHTINKPKSKSVFTIRPVYRMTVAASVLLIVAATIFFLQKNQPNNLSNTISGKTASHDIAAPSKSTASITLADGRHISLDDSNNGILAKQDGVSIDKAADGNITYRGNTLQLVYNTLNNPKGSKPVSLTLSDGSRVWLNTESSLRYPASFAGKDRSVEVSGEAYFEVQKDPSKPFRVLVSGKGTVEVLGTHFNISSYADEANTHVTLLEGSVRVLLPNPSDKVPGKNIVIEPGQQAFYPNNESFNSLSVKEQVDLNAVMAWKNGYFNFDHTDLSGVMRQLSRWYNIKVRYDGKIPQRTFGGEMQRDLNLSEVLKLLEKNNVHFSIENDQLIVKP